MRTRVLWMVALLCGAWLLMAWGDPAERPVAAVRALFAITFLLAGSLAWGLLLQGGDAPALREGSLRVMRSGWLLRAATACSLALAAAGAWFFRSVPAADRAWAWVALAAIASAALYLVYVAFLDRLSFDDFAIYERSPLGGRKEIWFDEMACAGWSALYQCHYIEADNGVRIYVPQMLSGWGELWVLLDEYTARFEVTQPA